MKNSKLIGAVMMVSLSFTACQKDDVLAPRQSADGQSFRKVQIASIPLQYPSAVKDNLAGTAKLFTYNDMHQLVSLSEVNLLSVFKYDNAGRAIQMIITDKRNFRLNQRFIEFIYDGDMDKPSKIVERDSDPAKDNMIFKTTMVKYDARWNKICETEISGDRAPLLTRTFDYDLKGNVIRVREVVGRTILSEKSFSEFDNNQSFDCNVPVLALIPGEFIQKNNAAHVAEMMTVGLLKTHNFSFTIDDLGYVTEVIEKSAGVDMLVKSISYAGKGVVDTSVKSVMADIK